MLTKQPKNSPLEDRTDGPQNTRAWTTVKAWWSQKEKSQHINSCIVFHAQRFFHRIVTDDDKHAFAFQIFVDDANGTREPTNFRTDRDDYSRIRIFTDTACSRILHTRPVPGSASAPGSPKPPPEPKLTEGGWKQTKIEQNTQKRRKTNRPVLAGNAKKNENYKRKNTALTTIRFVEADWKMKSKHRKNLRVWERRMPRKLEWKTKRKKDEKRKNETAFSKHEKKSYLKKNVMVKIKKE